MREAVTMDWGRQILRQNLDELQGLEKWATTNGLVCEKQPVSGDEGLWARLSHGSGSVEISILPPTELDTVNRTLGRWGLKISYMPEDVFDVLVPCNHGWQLTWRWGRPTVGASVENAGSFLVERLQKHFHLETATAAAKG